jgi:hypothetical protein
MRLTGRVSAIEGCVGWNVSYRHRFASPEIGRTGDGRSPGSRVVALTPTFPVSQWSSLGVRLAAYSCGGSHGLGPLGFSAPCSLLSSRSIPSGNHHEMSVGMAGDSCQ